MKMVGCMQVHNKDGELIGMGRLVGDVAMYWYLQEIVVLPEYQRHGIGAQLIEFAKEKYDSRFLWTLEKNKLYISVCGGQQYDKKTLFSGNYKICIGIIDVDGASFLSGRNYSLL